MDLEAYSEMKDFAFGVGIFNSQGICCYGTNTILEELEPASFYGKGKVILKIDRLNLINGTYYLDVAVHKRDGSPFDYHRNLYSFLIASFENDVGIFRPDHSWEFSSNIRIKRTDGKKINLEK
jgi:ABC-2 type transport system ATP-binding protein/lipopolysaccharide transport system ATP-binding protein